MAEQVTWLKQLGRDWDFLKGVLRGKRMIGKIDPESPDLICDDFEASVDRHADRPCFLFEGVTWTYRDFDERANRYAHWAREEGLEPGDVVALFMQNRPDYVACWYGLSKVGVVTALINNQLTEEPLRHCIAIAKAKAVIVDAELADLAAPAVGKEGVPDRIWAVFGKMEGALDLDAALDAASPLRPERAMRLQAGLKGDSPVLYIYTSGTTGLPKAARITNNRARGFAWFFRAMLNPKAADRMYLVLPLYHATGGQGGVGLSLLAGSSILLRRKFSATAFWDDVADNDVTMFAYIGELWRYLLNQPVHPKERAHKLNKAVGNGLRPEVWSVVQPRFGIDKIVEFYGSTEGNASLINFDGAMGAVGRVPGWMKSQVNVELVRFDMEAEEPMRGPDGFCIRCAPGETGELIGKINPDDVRQRFDGYAGDEKATSKKIMHDVFEKGDAYFRTGDLLSQDKRGYFYFVDRVGDTFRWKSENVSTTEVGKALTESAGVKEANVYGVEVPGHDGRAGAAVLVTGDDFDLDALHRHIHHALPAYARPLFLRLREEVEVTGTFKYRKVDLVREGFDPGKIGDELYFDHPQEGRYVPLDAALYQKIVDGAVRV